MCRKSLGQTMNARKIKAQSADLFILFQLIFFQDFFNDWENLLATCFDIFLLKKLSRHEVDVLRLEE